MTNFNVRGFALTPGTRRLLVRGGLLITVILLFRSVFGPSKRAEEIQSHGMLERVLLPEKYLDVYKYPFLQSRIGRDDRPDLFDEEVSDGIWDFWTRFQKPFITGPDTAHLDTQVMRGVVDDLLQFNGWVTAACQKLVRPFGQNSGTDTYDDLANGDNLYYIAIVVHSADHFLVDQLAIIVQLARRLGTRNIFVSMLDQGSSDSTPTLSDLCEAVLTVLGIAFRIRRVPPLTVNYYPLEEAEVRNAVLEPLHELHQKRAIKFHRVIWLKGFTCPMDVLESLRVSEVNKAAMTCGMDWAEHNGFFIFSDRWRTRDIAGDLFRQARSSSKPEAGPPRDKVGTERYAQHLPFQVFCCESGTHVVDPEQSYYKGIEYRASPNALNLTANNDVSTDPETPCMDSAQMWFCRDLWIDAATTGLKTGGRGHRRGSHKKKRDIPGDVVENIKPIVKRDGEKKEEQKKAAAAEKKAAEAEKKEEQKKAAVAAAIEDDPAAQPAVPIREADMERRQDGAESSNDDSGTNIDAMDEDAANPAPGALPKEDLPFMIPNSEFLPARILVNPRCLTTYGGVSHTKLALDLFNDPKDHAHRTEGNYVVEDWVGAPDSFVCQEMRTTGGRTAPKSQRRVSFLLQQEVSTAAWYKRLTRQLNMPIYNT